jgi:hypothetical protein
MNPSYLVERTRTGLWNHRISDFVAVALVTCALMEFCSEILGVRDSPSIVVLALACASHPLLRLLEARRSGGAYRARRGAEVAALIAAAPWIVLSWLRTANPSWWVWQPVPVPAAMRYTGIALACGVVLLRPLFERDSAEDALYIPPITLQSQLLMISLLLVSGSVIAASLTFYWLAARAIQHLVAPSGNIGSGVECELPEMPQLTR